MRTRSAMLILSALMAAAALLIALSQRRLQQAQRGRSAAEQALIQTARDARSITELRMQSQTIETRQRPAQDVIAQVNAVLAEVGIPSTHMQSLTPEGDSTADPPASSAATGGPRLRQQSLRLTMQALSPAQIGSFLTHWQSTQSVWNATRLELMHNNRPPPPDSAAGNLYDATMVMTAMYLAESPRPESPDAGKEGSP